MPSRGRCRSLRTPTCCTWRRATATAEIAENVDLDIADGEALLSFVHERNIGLVVIGPEAPLVDGVADLLRADGVPVFGPTPTAPSWKALKPIPRNS